MSEVMAGDAASSEDLLKRFFDTVLPDAMADDLLVRSTAQAMHAKLRLSREERGKGGWHTDSCENAVLWEMVQSHLDKGMDPDNLIDLINLLGMMRLRTMIYGAKA